MYHAVKQTAKTGLRQQQIVITLVVIVLNARFINIIFQKVYINAK